MEEVHVELDGRCAVATLDRPRALNALTLEMIHALLDALARWREDERVAAVLLRSASPRAFCSGGDVKAIRAATLAGDDAWGDAFYSTEYTLDEAIATYPKPVVALVDGICMGGGMGIAVPARFRVATERATFAMPEVGIGFFPDVGASHFLSRLPDELGLYLGMTAARFGVADAVHTGLATHFAQAARLRDVEHAVREHAADGAPRLAAVLAARADPPPPSRLAAHQKDVRDVFGAPSPGEIVERLERRGDAWARETLAALRKGSPLAVAVTWALLRHGHGLPLHDCYEQERRLARVMRRTPDFLEGVRAAVIDKDGRPRWAHRDVREVRAEDLAAALTALRGSPREEARAP